MNKFVTNFIPKDSNLSSTRNWEGWIQLDTVATTPGYVWRWVLMFKTQTLTCGTNWTTRCLAQDGNQPALKLMEELKKERENNLKGRQHTSGTVAPMGGEERGGESVNKSETSPLSKTKSFIQNPLRFDESSDNLESRQNSETKILTRFIV
jgi:hypothetical protein